MKKHFEVFQEPATRWAAAVLVGVTLFRLWYCTYNNLAGDEAYYWLWSRHLDLSYFSKGPAVAWTIAFGTWLFGDTEFGVRWPSVLLSLGTGWQMYWLGRRLYSPEVGLWTILVAAITPLFALGSVVMTIDPLSVFFWVWSANQFLDAIEGPGVLRWILLGSGVGAGFLAKYTNGLELVSFLGFLIFSPHRRPQRARSEGALGLITFLIVISPVLYWNQVHHWITAQHLSEGGHLKDRLGIHFIEFLKFLEGQALAYSPVLLVAILSVCVYRLFRAVSWRETFLLWLFWPIFGGYALLSFRKAANLNWPALAYIGGLILTISTVHQWLRVGKSWSWPHKLLRAATVLGLALAFFATVLLHETFPLHLAKDPSTRLWGWKEWGGKAESFRALYHPDFLLSNDYSNASELSFYLPGHPQTYIPNTGRIENQFSFWPTYSHRPGETALYLTDDPIDKLPGLLTEEFSRVESVGSFERSYRGRHIETYRVWLLRN